MGISLEFFFEFVRLSRRLLGFITMVLKNRRPAFGIYNYYYYYPRSSNSQEKQNHVTGVTEPGVYYCRFFLPLVRTADSLRGGGGGGGFC
jgi:hypothetical protein